MEARKVANKLVEYMLLNGIPDEILTNQGTNYQSLLLAEVYDLIDIHRFRTSPYHPATDGISERTVGAVKATITTYALEHAVDWDTLLNKISFAFNT